MVSFEGFEGSLETLGRTFQVDLAWFRPLDGRCGPLGTFYPANTIDISLAAVETSQAFSAYYSYLQ